MRPFLCIAAIAACWPLPAAAKPKAPSRAEIARALRPLHDKRPVSVGDVLADLGDGRHPVLYKTRGEGCVDGAVPEQEASCSGTAEPWVALVRRDGPAITVVGKVALPGEAWETQSELKWGVSKVADHDGDGKPELLLTFGYDGPTQPAVGSTYHKRLAVLNLDPLAVAADVPLDERPQALVFDMVESTWKIVAGPPAAIQVRRKVGRYDEKSNDRVVTEQATSYVHDGKLDRWVEDKRR